MEAILNYLFPKTETKPKETMETDTKVYITWNNEMRIYRLSNIRKITDKKELYAIANDIAIHVAESFDQEEVTNGNIILDEIEKMLTAQ